MTDKQRYFIPAQAVEVSTEIKRSRFIAYIAHCPDTEKAFQVIDQVKQRYPGARHHCWAFMAGTPTAASAVRFSDDGEPSGTAGKPILKVLQYSHYGEIICIVSRYFGGIKLGAGGLGRAYSSSAQAALEQLPVTEKIPLSQVSLQLPYAFEATVRNYLGSIDAAINEVIYNEQVIFQIAIDQRQLQPTLLQANNLCKGSMAILTMNPDCQSTTPDHLETWHQLSDN